MALSVMTEFILFLRHEKRRKLRVQVTGEIGGLLYLSDCNNPIPNETFLKPGFVCPSRT